MSDQSESDELVHGDIVWVKFQRLWWPARIIGHGLHPDSLYKPNKRPKYIVQFLTEQTYECVYHRNEVCRYNSRRKDQFLKRGYALYVERKKNMHLFIEDVRMAEQETNGNPDILNNEKYHPPPKPDYSTIFGSARQKKVAANIGRGRGRRKASVTESPPNISGPSTQNASFRAAHTTPTLYLPYYGPSTSAIYRTPESAATSSNTYKCTYAPCKFETTRLNNLITHNKFHANETEMTITPAKKTPVTSSTKKAPAKPAHDSSDENNSDLEDRPKKVPQKRGRKPGQKNGQGKKFTVTPTVKVETKPKTPRRSRKDIETVITEGPIRENITIEKPMNELALKEKPIEIKSKILADWSEDEDDSSMPSTSNQPAESAGTKSLEDSSPNQSGDEKQKSPKAIRNIPKKDRRGNILDEFYSSQVPGTHAPESTTNDDTEKEEENGQEATILIDSDDELLVSTERPDETKVNDDEMQPSTSDNEVTQQSEEIAQEERKHETIEIGAPIIIEDEEIVEKITDEESPVEEQQEEEVEENNDNLELLKKSADLLEETSQLQKNIESIGIIGKKRRLQIKHKTDDESDNMDNSTGRSIEIESINDESTTEMEPKSQSEPESDKNDVEPETSAVSKPVELLIEDKIPSICSSDNVKLDEIVEPAMEEKEQTEDETPTGDEINDSVEERIDIIAPSSQKKLQVEEEPLTSNELIHDPVDEITVESKPISETPTSEKPKCEEPILENLEENDSKPKSEKLISQTEIELKTETKEIKIDTVNKNDNASKERRRSSARLRSPIQIELKTYRSTRRKTKSTGSEIVEAKPESTEIIIPPTVEVVETIAEEPEEPEEPEVPKVELNIEMVAETSVEMATEETNNDNDNDNDMKAEAESSPTKSDFDSSKMEVDCFDFKEEDEEIPQTLNRRKRRFLTPGKVFELQPVDKLEEIRKEEEEKSKRFKVDKEETVKNILETVPMKNDEDSSAVQSSDQNSSPEKSPEKQVRDDDVKDKTLPPKERGKRIFKSRNRSRLSEGELFSSEDKIKELNMSSESIEKLSIGPINDIPKMKFDEEPVIIVGAAEITIETQQKEVESTVDQENDQIESEIANTLITMTASTSSSQNEPDASSCIEAIAEPDSSVKITISLDEEEPTETKRESDKRGETVPSPSKKKRKSTIESIESATSEVSIPSEPINPVQPLKRYVPSPKPVSGRQATVNTIIMESSDSTVSDMEVIAESPKPLKIESPKPTSQIILKPGPSDISRMTSSSPPIKKKSQRSSKKVPVKIGYDVHGNEIITYRYPSDKPVVHLPSHIQTPDMVQSAINPRMMHKKEPPTPQMATTSRGVISQAPSTSGVVRQTIQTKTPSRNQQQLQRTVLQQPEQMHHIIINEQPVQRSINSSAQHQQQQMRNILQMQAKQNVRTQRPQASTSTGQRGMSNARVGRQPKKQPEPAPVQIQQESDSQENQLLAVPAENFGGPPGAFFLCSTVSGKIQPIDRTALYLDKTTNQLMPAPLDVAGLQEAAAIQDVAGLQDVVTMQDEIAEEDQTVQEYSTQEEQIAANTEEGGGVRYMLVLGDGERILLDQQCYEQLTQGQVPTLVTPDGQQLMLQIQPNDLSAAVQLNQPEMSQMIINEGTISGDENNQDILATAMAGSDFPPEQYMGEMMQQIESASMEVEPLGFQTINQAPTSETNAILEQPPIMSTLVQPSKKDGPSTSVDCSNLDESLAVIGVTAPTTNVPTSLELPITVTNPNIAPKTTSAMTTIYSTNVPVTLPIGSLTSELINPSLGIVGDTIEVEHPEELQMVQLDQNIVDIDGTSEIVPNTPETENNHNFISDNSNSSEIPLQSDLILISTDNVSSTEIRNGNRIAARNNHQQNRCNNRNNNQSEVNALILNDNSFDNHDAALLLNVNSHSGYQRSQNHSRNNPHHSRNNRNGRNRPNLSRSNAQESHSFIIDENVIGTNEFDANDVEMSDR